MGVSLAKTAPAARPVTLEKFTPGRRALADAVDEQGPGGVKFISVRHVHEWSCLDASTEVLYGGGGMLMMGYFTRDEYANTWGIIDGMMSRGLGHFAVVTQPPNGELTVTRYVVREGQVYSAAAWAEKDYGPAEGETLTGVGLQAWESARRSVAHMDAQHIRRVADILSAREVERERAKERAKERAAARLASATGDATA